MILRIALALLLLLGPPASAEVIPFYIGTFTDQAGSKGIYRSSLDTDTGKLAVPTLAVEAKSPNFLALSPDYRFIFAALDSTVGSYRVRADGTLLPLNEQPSGGGVPCYVSLDESARHLFVANYVGGNIAAFAVHPDGTIGDRTALISFTGSGPDATRQTKPYAHSVYVDPEGKFVYACDLGSDHVWIFRLRAERPFLVPAVPPSAQVPPGSGPRHLAFSPNGKFVYVVSEMGLGVTVFSRNSSSGALTALETVSNLPPDTPTTGSTAAEIFCHPSGRWLYVSTRGADKISVFAIAPDGKLNLTQSVPAGVKVPRSFALDPMGKWLVTAGQGDNRLAVLRIDQATGQLTATDQAIPVPAPVCVLFVPQK
jgi:6-phosphogluconolactonase